MDYLDWAERVVDGLRGVNGPLEKAFDDALAHARGLVVEADE